MMDMVLRYQKMTTHDLRALRAKKYLRITKLSGINRGWFDEREYKAEKALIKQIDAELRCRTEQLPLL